MADAPFSVRFFPWAEGEDLRAAVRIRFTVFVEEQGVPEDEELDENDPVAEHVLVIDRDGAPVATARLYTDNACGDGRIGRMATLKSARGKGAGSAAMAALMERALKRGFRRVILDAQVQAIPFYEKHGFRVYGEEHLDCGIPHKEMEWTVP